VAAGSNGGLVSALGRGRRAAVPVDAFVSARCLRAGACAWAVPSEGVDTFCDFVVLGIVIFGGTCCDFFLNYTTVERDIVGRGSEAPVNSC
jgi:hypothetical protein